MLGFEEDKMQWELSINHTSGRAYKEVHAHNTVTGFSETVTGVRSKAISLPICCPRSGPYAEHASKWA
jgi:hypothetical protein